MSFEKKYIHHPSGNLVLLLFLHKAQDALGQLKILIEHQTVGKTQSEIQQLKKLDSPYPHDFNQQYILNTGEEEYKLQIQNLHAYELPWDWTLYFFQI